MTRSYKKFIISSSEPRNAKEIRRVHAKISLVISIS